MNNCSARLIVLLVAVLTPVFLALFFIHHYGVNVPHWDQWEFVALLEKVYAGNFSAADLFAQHNEHRLIFPKLFMLLLAAASDYNTLIEMYFGWLLLVLSGVVIFNSYRRSFGWSQSAVLKFLPVPWLLFSWCQYENLLWGWQVTFFMTALAAVLTHSLLDSSRALDRYFVVAIFCAIVASFSNSNGLLVWPIGLLQLWTGRKPERLSRSSESVWIFAAACVGILYFIDYAKPQSHPSLLHVFTSPGSVLRYFLTVLGSPLAVKRGMALGVGIWIAALGISIYIVEFRNAAKIAVTFWDALILFALLSCLMLAVGRAGFGVGQALASRYTTFTLLGVVGLYVKSLEPFSAPGKFPIVIRLALLCLIVQGLGVALFHGATKANAMRASRQASVDLLRHLESQADQPVSKFLYPSPQRVRQLTPFLQKQKLSVFSRADALR
ncbi:MAG: hypothetical protein EXR70_19830 [Deltaproteobacteria bacterium]|nr:hypothetical protein [Deltaproteobacteria bacterium]